jgi:hypothetical protein
MRGNFSPAPAMCRESLPPDDVRGGVEISTNELNWRAVQKF